MKVSCKDMGMTHCPFVAEGHSEEEVEGKLLHHGIEQHHDKMMEMDEPATIGMMQTMHRALRGQKAA